MTTINPEDAAARELGREEIARLICGAYTVSGKCPLCCGDCIDWSDNLAAADAVLAALASRSAPDAGWSNIAATALLQINNDASLDMAARKIAREALDKLPSLAATKEG